MPARDRNSIKPVNNSFPATKRKEALSTQKNIMKKIIAFPAIIILCQLVFSCTKTGELTGTADGRFSGSSSSLASSGGSGSGGGNGGSTAGIITAGEWNDLNNWSFWNALLQRDTIKKFPGVWGFYHQNKVTVILKDALNKLIHDAKINLVYNGNTTSAKTSNDGKAELFASMFQPDFKLNNFSLSAEYMGRTFNLGSYSSSQAVIVKDIPVNKSVSNTLDIMFTVDATGSMGDEISYLKNELKDVINRAGGQLPGTKIRMGSVFYRDNGDAYLTRPFDFSTSADQLLNFINNQVADGGGDFPEAVDEALKTSIEDQQWSSTAVNRLLFLILDAPPHKDQAIINKLKTAVTVAQQKGIRIIPVSASGIDWETEFLLRFLSISTNSTYVFITNDSGIGNSHLTPTVGKYDVEYLNNLMVRLITKYGQNQN